MGPGVCLKSHYFVAPVLVRQEPEHDGRNFSTFEIASGAQNGSSGGLLGQEKA